MMITYLPKHTIQKPNKGWKELYKIGDEELVYGFSKNFNIKKKGIREKLNEMRIRRNLKEKEKYGSEEDEEEQEKARKLIADSEKHFKEWLKNKEQYPFDHNNFGKKQKKDIKGMIKKILLYGGLPTLLVVSLGVLSNKKVTPNRVKKNIKVKANVQEKIFKKAFVSKLKEYYKTKGKEINKMDIKEKENLADTNKRQINRDLAANAAENRIIQNKKIPTTPPRRKSSSNPQQSSKTPPRKKTLLEKIKERQNKTMLSKKKFISINNKKRLEKIKERQNETMLSKKKFISINNNKKEWSYEKEKDSNYYIKDEKIYNKRGKLTKYIYTEKDGLAKIMRDNVVPFLKTEKLKKE